MSLLRTKPLLMLLTGHPPQMVRELQGNYQQMFVQQGDIAPDALEVIDLQIGEWPQAPEYYCGVVITGSAKMVTEHLCWSELTADWLRQAMKIELPILGVCYGHQLLAYALGGEVGYHAQGMEVGTLDIELLPEAQQDDFCHALPERFTANLLHAQTVITIPPGARTLGRSAHDPHQIVRYGPKALGVQFHPEFNGSVMKNFLDWLMQTDPQQQPLWQQKIEQVADTPVSQKLLQTFVQQLS